MILYLNGRFVDRGEAGIDPLERGFLLGHGAFETMRVEEGQILHFEGHLDRLRRSLRLLCLPQRAAEGGLREVCEQVLDANGLAFARLRVTVASAATEPSSPAGALRTPPTVLVHAEELPAGACRELAPTARLELARFPLNERSPLCRTKCTNYAERLVARSAAMGRRMDDALFVNTQGRLAEGTMANVFVVRADGSLVTPPTSEGALPGIMRGEVLGIARELGLGAREEAVHPGELQSAREVFLTNVIRQVVPVRSVEGWRMKARAPGPVTRRLHAAYRDRVAGELQRLRGA